MAVRRITEITPKAQAVMDMMLANPGASLSDCARELSLSRSWVSIVVNSPVFQKEYQARRRAVQQSLDEEIERVAKKALVKLGEAV